MARPIKSRYVLDLLVMAYNRNEELMNLLSKMEVGNTKPYVNEDGVEEFYLMRLEPHGKYQYVFCIVVNDGEDRWVRFGLLYFGAFSKFLQQIYIRVDNEVLYNDNLLAYRFGLEMRLGLEFRNFKQIDVAFDTELNIPYRFMKYYKNFEDYALIVNRKECKNEEEVLEGLFHIKRGSRKRPYKEHGFDLKSKNGNISLRCYDKLKELANSEKEYISDTYADWMAVYRLEVSLRTNKEISTTMNSIVENRISLLPYEENAELFRKFVMGIGMSAKEREAEISISRRNENAIQTSAYIETFLNLLRDEEMLKEIHEKTLFRLVHFRKRNNRELFDLIPLLESKLSK